MIRISHLDEVVRVTCSGLGCARLADGVTHYLIARQEYHLQKGEPSYANKHYQIVYNDERDNYALRKTKEWIQKERNKG